jgi:hypothetical protein
MKAAGLTRGGYLIPICCKWSSAIDVNLGHLEVETTIDDPGAYVGRWTLKTSYELRPNQEVSENVCENNR